MALTNGHHVFAGLHEDAFNKFIKAYRTARPKYFYYACPPLGAGSPGVDFWVIPPLPVPGTNAGMPISVRILDALLDFRPAQAGLHLPAPLVLGPNQFAFTVKDVGALESLIECYTETMINSLLDALRYPVEKFALGSFASLSLADGPLIADNQLKVWADIS